MDLWMNFGFAWISVILALFLSVIYILRVMGKKDGRFKSFLNKLNKSMRKHHKKIGILLVATGLVHGLFSSESVFSLNLGTISWVASVLLGLNWMVRKHLSRFKGWMYYHRFLTAAFLTLIVLHVVDVGGIQVQNILFNSPEPVAYEDQANNIAGKDRVINDNTNQEDTNQEVVSNGVNDAASLEYLNKQFEDAELKDGVYEGEATGYRAGLKVSVEVKDNSIVNVEVTDHNEVNRRFYSTPIEVIPTEIVENQSLDVDMVSGATFTSVGIVNAVKDALSKALISGELPEDKELPQKGFGKRRH